jgi:hypothetical protein
MTESHANLRTRPTRRHGVGRQPLAAVKVAGDTGVGIGTPTDESIPLNQGFMSEDFASARKTVPIIGIT